MGVAGPITGPNAAFGAQLKNGAQQAVDDINAAGGMNGQKITLSFGDDVSDPKQGVSVANKFVGALRACDLATVERARKARAGRNRFVGDEHRSPTCMASSVVLRVVGVLVNQDADECGQNDGDDRGQDPPVAHLLPPCRHMSPG